MKYCLFFLIALMSAGPAVAEDLLPADFAYGYILETDGEGGIFSVVVPDEIHQMVKRADLGDLRVFNAAGEVVPHLLRPPPAADEGSVSREDVPFFPLQEGRGQAGETDLALQVQKNSQGTIIRIDAGNNQPGGEKAVSSYLFDVSGLKIEARGFELTWPAGGLSTTTVSLQQSDDLVHWLPLVEKAVLADLQHQGQRIIQRTVHLPRNPMKYVKMQFLGEEHFAALDKVTVFSGRDPVMLQRHWLGLEKGTVGHNEEGASVVEYRSPSRLSVNGVRLRFREPNSMLRAIVQSRPDDKSPWVPRCSGVFYALQIQDARIENDLCLLAETADQYWRLAVVEDGVGLEKTGRVPILELGWTPVELLFLSRGPAPYTLAFGSGRLVGEGGTAGAEMIRQALSSEAKKVSIRPAVFGKRLELSGKMALQAPAPPLPWRQWLLWGLLCGGLVLMGWMVKKLIREMRLHD